MLSTLLLLLLTSRSSKPQPLDYPLEAQVQTTGLVNICGDAPKGVDCGYVQHLTMVVDGKHFEVHGTAYSSDILAAGTYKARMQSETTHGTNYLHTRIFRLLFPD